MIGVAEIQEDELDRWIAVHNVVFPHDPQAPETMLDWKRQAEATAWFLARADGVDTGVAVAVIGWHAEAGVARTEAGVLPERRGRGIGTALLAAAARWAREAGMHSGDAAVDETDAASLAWAQRRGFVEVGRQSRLVLDLRQAAHAQIDAPPGIEIASWAQRPDALHGMYEVACEAYPDVPGEEHVRMAAFEQWLANDLKGAGDRPEATFVALAGGEVVGYAKLSLPAARPDTAFHDITGVRRAWRGRGIAGALKRAEIAWAKRQGYARLETYNEVRNEPIRRLNDRHGYVVEPGLVMVRGPLPA